jgi:Fe-S oxidoreductase
LPWGKCPLGYIGLGAEENRFNCRYCGNSPWHFAGQEDTWCWVKIVLGKPACSPGECLVDFVYPEQGVALLKALKDQGVQVEYPLGQTCCGLPAKMMGEKEVAVKAEQLVGKLIDFSPFFTRVLKVKVERFKGGKKVKVAYHSPCHLCRGLGVVEEPRDLLAIAGLEYVPVKDEDTCCGMGGSYSMDFPEISAEVLKKKLDAVEETGADLLVTDCPGCVLQLKGGMDKRGGKVKVKHIAEAVAEATK